MKRVNPSTGKPQKNRYARLEVKNPSIKARKIKHRHENNRKIRGGKNPR